MSDENLLVCRQTVFFFRGPISVLKTQSEPSRGARVCSKRGSPAVRLSASPEGARPSAGRPGSRTPEPRPHPSGRAHSLSGESQDPTTHSSVSPKGSPREDRLPGRAQPALGSAHAPGGTMQASHCIYSAHKTSREAPLPLHRGGHWGLMRCTAGRGPERLRNPQARPALPPPV